jgi:hypothetical protein
MESTHPSRAATRIQASFRGHLVRRDVVDAARRDFEEIARRVERAALGHLPANVPFASARAPRLGPAKAEASAPRERARALPILAPRDPTPSTRADDTTNPSTSSSGSATEPANAPADAPADAFAPERVVGDDARRLVTLREELAWARAALDDRRQHLRRMRRDAAWEDNARTLARDVLSLR